MAENHSFDIDVAQVVGVNAAIILGSIRHWCKKNSANGKHYHDGRYWSYNSTKAFCEMYPYLGRSAIDNALKKLEDGGYILIGNYNKTKYDRTRWYSITDEGLALFYPQGKMEDEIHSLKQGMEVRESRNGSAPKQEPIPVLDSYLASSSNNMAPEKKSGRKQKPFVAPTLEEVKAYVSEKGYHFEAQFLFDYYEANNWHFKNGKPVKNWKQCCVTWESRWKEGQSNRGEGVKHDYTVYDDALRR